MSMITALTIPADRVHVRQLCSKVLYCRTCEKWEHLTCLAGTLDVVRARLPKQKEWWMCAECRYEDARFDGGSRDIEKRGLW